MEKNNPSTDLAPTTEEFDELLQRFILLRPMLILPEQINRFKQEVIESLRNSKKTSAEDFHYVMYIFIALAHHKNPPTMGELSVMINTPCSTATRIVDSLVKNHFIERFSDPADRRVVRVRLTETGRSLHQSFIDLNKQRIELLLKHFSVDEKIQLINLFKKLLDSITEHK